MSHTTPRLGGYSLTESGLWLSDNTIADVSTTRHGLTPKLPNDATKFLNGVGGYTVPAGTGGGTIPTSGWTDVNGILRNDYLVPRVLGIRIRHNPSTNWRFATQSLNGASTYSFIATLDCYVQVVDSITAGFYLYDGTKVITFELLWNGSVGPAFLRVVRLTNVTTEGATMAGPTGQLVAGMFTAKIVKDATNRTFYYWNAGAWTQFYQEAASAFLTETDIGVGGINVAATSAYGLNLNLLDWSLT